jgi:hypothetical protein
MPSRPIEPPQAVNDSNTHYRLLSHQIRRVEASLALAQRRRRWSNIALILGPFLLVVLFELYWVLRGHNRLMEAIYIPGGLLAVSSAIAAAKLKLTPGGIPTGPAGEKMARPRESEASLELELARLRDERKVVAGDVGMDMKVRRIAYRDEAYDEIRSFRDDSARYRRVNNILQAILIVGSLAATGASAIVGEIPSVRWVTLGITFVVGISSGFMGYSKYKERSFYLQQTADAIESEWEAVDVGVGRYKDFSDDEEKSLALFVDEVHRLKSEQKKRQQSLEQPPESRGPKE